MLSGSFYNIISKDTSANGSFTYEIQFQEDHPVFKGHFPQSPVIPGVFIIQIIQELTENAIDKKLRLTGARKIKFLSLVVPGGESKLMVSLSIVSESVDQTVDAVATFTGKPCLKLHARFTGL